MKKSISVVLICVASFALWYFWLSRLGELPPLYKKPYIVVYGRDACGLTRQCLGKLSKAGIYCRYKNIDDANVQKELYPRMKKAGLDTSHFLLPVVDVNGKILISPQASTVVELYNKSSLKSKKTYRGEKGKTCRVEKRSSKTPVKTVDFNKDPLEISGIIMGKVPIAIIGGKSVRVGEKVGSYDIVEIQSDSVKFRDAEGKVFIKKIN